MIGHKIKNYSSFKFLPENLEKFRLTGLSHAPLQGPTIFHYCSSTGRMLLKSYQLAELKYEIFSRTGRKTKKLRCSKLFLSMVSKLLEGSTFLFQYSSITRTLLRELSIRRVKKCNFSRIERKTEE